MNEFKKMQKLAGLITESEYQEAANIMDMAKSAHLDALKKELNSSDLDNWYITAASNANGIEITSTNQLQNFTTEHDDKGNVIDAYLYKIQRKPSSQKSLSITPVQKKEFLDRIKNIDSVNLEMDAANILARVLTNDEAEFIEDVEDFGFDPEAVEDLAQELVSTVNESQLNEVELENYMFFSNLKQMKRQIEMMMEMDPVMVDSILQNGHDWADDHISEAKNNMDQVFDFLKNEMDKSYSLNEEKKYSSFPEWLNAFMEEYKDEPSIIDPIKENGLDKAQTDEEFYNMVKEKGKEVGKNYAGEKSFIVYGIGKNISSVAPVNSKGKQLYFVNFGTGLSTYGSWFNNNSNIIVPSSTDQSSKIYPQGSRKD